MTPHEPDTEELLRLAATGDWGAVEALLVRHRPRLLQMVAVRLDRRVSARVDPSDVVQEVLLMAHRRLDEYLRSRPVAFYPWLRQIAWDRLVEIHRQHIQAQKRSVRREAVGSLPLPEDSALELVERLGSLQGGRSEAVREELRERVQGALARLPERDREVLVLRHLEQLSTRETAEVLAITEGAVKVRHLRAVERLRRLLGEASEEGTP